MTEYQTPVYHRVNHARMIVINRKVIGTEGVPNIYISSVSVHDSSEQSNKSDTIIKMELMFNNGLNNYKQPIFNYSSGRNAATVTLVYVYNKQVFEALLSSKTEREKKKIIKTQAGFGNLKTEEVALPPLDVRKLTTHEVTPIYIKKEFKVDSKKESCYVMANIKRGPILGPTTSETILEAKVVTQDSFVFKVKGKSQIWTDPVHEHKGKFMGGSFHTEKKHPILVKVNSPNYKTKDLRKLKELPIAPKSSSSRKQSENNYFSDIKHSQAENGSLNLMFSINTKEILIKKSKYSSILKSYNEDVFNAVAQQVGIKTISVYFKNKNQPQKEIASSGELAGTVPSVYYYRDSLTTRPKKYSSIREQEHAYSILEEVVFNTDSNIRTFRCQIDEKEVQSIKLMIEIQDPFEKYLNNLMAEAKTTNNTIKKYSSMLRKGDVFDRSTRRFKEQTLADKYDDSLELWYRPIETFMKINVLTRKMSNAQIRQETTKTFEKMAPRSCTPDSIDIFVGDFSKTLTLFISKYSLRTKQAGMSRRSGRSSPTPRRDTLEKKYNINYKFNKRALSYMKTTDVLGQVPIYTKTEFAAAIEAERAKFMNTSNTYSSTTARASLEAIQGANSEKYENFNFSPNSIHNLSNVMNFSDISLLDEARLGDFYRSNLLDSIDLNSLFGKNLTVQIYEEEENFTDTNSTLGSDSAFQSAPDQFQRQFKRTSLPKDVLRTLGRQNNNNYGLFNKLDVTTPKNFLSAKTLKDAERIPFQHKFFSNSEKMGSLFSSTREFLSNRPLTKDLAFFNIQKVLFDAGYRRDSSGTLIVGIPIKKEMSNQQFDSLSQPILCELVSYEDPSLVNRRNSFNNYTKINTFFVIIPDRYDFKKTIKAMVQPFSSTLRSDYERYVSTTIYETKYLRNNMNTETVERKRNIPSRQRKTPSALATRMAGKRTEQNRTTPQRPSREEKNEEKMRLMAAKTVTEDNKSVEEIVRPRPIPKKSRLTTEETDSPAPTERQRPSRSSSRSTPTSPRSSSRSTRSTSSAPTTRTRGRRSGY